MIQSLKDHFDARFAKGKWYFSPPKKIDWKSIFFSLTLGGGVSFAGTRVLLHKLGLVEGNYSESPPGAGWFLGPLFALIGLVILSLGFIQFAGDSLSISKTSIKRKWNFTFFSLNVVALSKTNLKDLSIEGDTSFSFKLVGIDPLGKKHSLAESDNRPALEELTRFIREYMELD
jgi:hypothetical protein